MKLSFAVIFLVVLIQGTIGNPLIFDRIGDIASGIAKGVSDTAGAIGQNFPFSNNNNEVSNDGANDNNNNGNNDGNSDNNFSVSGIFGNIAKGAADIAGGAGQTAAKAAENAFRLGTQATKGFIDVATGFGKAVENGIQNSIRRFVNIGRGIGRISNSILRNAINDASNNIKNAQNALREINNISQNRLRNAMNRLNNTIDAAHQLQNWTQAERSRFNESSDSAKQQANKILDDFMKQRQQETQECAKGAIDPIEKAFNETRKFSESNLPAVHNILDIITRCMSSSPTPTTVGRCIRDIRQNGATLISIPRRAFNLKRTYLGSNIDEILNSPCIAESRFRTEQQKKNIEKQLDELLEKDLYGTDSTTLSSEETSEASTEGTSEETSTTSSSNSQAPEESTTSSSTSSGPEDTTTLSNNGN